jgi:two-component system, OmpR family, KDP operon response regulator KdpE
MVEGPFPHWRFAVASRPPALEPLVLVVDPEVHSGPSIESVIEGQGFRTMHASTRAGDLTRAVECEPDLILIDLSHPTAEGVGLAAWLRDLTRAPILAVVSRSREEERGSVLDAGANDYVVHPFEVSDLLGRIRVWLRQTARVQSQRLLPESSTERLRIDRDRRVVFVDGREVHITPLECKLLLTLAHNQNRGITEEQILAAVWGKGSGTAMRHLRARVRHLRQKLERDPARPRYLVAEGGRYRLHLG